VEVHEMDKEKLKLIIRNLESLVDCLKSEVYSDTDSYLNYEDVAPHLTDYDEIFDDDDYDYDDVVTNRINNSYRLVNDDDGDGL
jgi:hypothetical protein